MQLVDRHETGTTDLLILDAQRIDEPPVATLGSRSGCPAACTATG